MKKIILALAVVFLAVSARAKEMASVSIADNGRGMPVDIAQAPNFFTMMVFTICDFKISPS